MPDEYPGCTAITQGSGSEICTARKWLDQHHMMPGNNWQMSLKF